MGAKGRPKAKSLPRDEHKPRAVEASAIRTEKLPRKEFTPTDPDRKLVILFSRVDVDGPWCLTRIQQGHHRDLLRRIQSFESMTVQEAFLRGGEPGKEYPLPQIPNKAIQDRLRELELDDRDEISRLRISGAGHLYGFRERERFYVLWWDPGHEIWPSKKRHT
jgi:hypothetical protein